MLLLLGNHLSALVAQQQRRQRPQQHGPARAVPSRGEGAHTSASMSPPCFLSFMPRGAPGALRWGQCLSCRRSARQQIQQVYT